MVKVSSSSLGIDAEKECEEDGEAPEGGSTIAEEGEGYADDRGKTKYHPYVDEEVKEEDAEDAVAVDTSEGARLSLGDVDEPQQQQQEEEEDGGTSHETLFLAHGAEDEVGVLFGDVLELCLCAIEETFPLQASGTDGYLGLYDVVACPSGVILHTKENSDACLLVFLQEVVHDVVGGVEECEGGEGEECYGNVACCLEA